MFAIIICLLTTFNQTAQGQTVINPGFETDSVPPFPGNGAITGWTGGSGINAGGGPFTDNGTIPEGQKAAFLAGAGGAMRQTVAGFTVGASYRLRYYENARNCCGARSANLQVTAGGVTVVAAHEVVAVGASNPYVLKVSEPFTATAEALEIAFITSGTGDYTVLLDRIEIGRNLIVTNTNDSGAGSLRQTIADAPAGSFISFSETLGDTISLGSVIETNKNLTIVGPGAEALTLRGGGIQPRSIDNGQFDTLAISGLTIADGIGLYSFGSGFIGGAINVILTDSIVRGNRGSGIFCGLQVNMTIARSLISENEGLYGGGIHNEGTVTINDSIISGNTGIRGGGGIYNFNEFPGRFTARVTVNNSSITGNVGGTGGVYIGSGGIYNGQGEVILTNSTVSGNLAKQFYVCPGCINEGAGIRGFVLLINSTVTDNIAGLSGTGGFFTARNSILASVNSTLNSQGYNLISNLNTNITGDTTGNILNTDARLGPLGYYGGRTPTRPLLSGSPAINACNTATSPALDQRGASRVGAADIGAFELNNSGNGGNFVVRLPDAFTGTAFSHQLSEVTFEHRRGGSFNYSLGGGAPSGVSLIDEDKHVSLAGRTGQTGVYNFSVTGTDGTNSVVTNYSIRVLDSGLPPLPGGCRSNPIVTNKLNAGEGSLRQAIYDVCPGGTIGFSAAPGTIHLTGGRLLINKNLTIEGPGAGALTIRNAGGRGGNGIFRVESGVSAVIAGLTAGDGYAPGITNSGTLTLTNMTVRDNVKGGIENLGTLTVASSIISGNGSDPTGYDFRVPYTSDILGAGGINSFGSGSLTVTDSTIAENTGRESGGIYTGSMTMTNSTVRNNRLFGNAGGGGITFAEQDLNSTVTNSTISGNIGGSDDEGSGGIKLKRGTLRLINSTVAYNRK
ncbi:MAG: right-handed parallel beta-helix repeat-containing protein, partial [Chthoniobacterales bacterium]|nr:right-handed parallel beta-helix repeat-containing protein [Chthoniobacterales bacterium]